MHLATVAEERGEIAVVVRSGLVRSSGQLRGVGEDAICGHDPVASARAGSSALSLIAASSRTLSSGLTAAANAARTASTVENRPLAALGGHRVDVRPATMIVADLGQEPLLDEPLQEGHLTSGLLVTITAIACLNWHVGFSPTVAR